MNEYFANFLLIEGKILLLSQNCIHENNIFHKWRHMNFDLYLNCMTSLIDDPYATELHREETGPKICKSFVSQFI